MWSPNTHDFSFCESIRETYIQALCCVFFFLLTPVPTVSIKNNFNIVFALLHTGKLWYYSHHESYSLVWPELRSLNIRNNHQLMAELISGHSVTLHSSTMAAMWQYHAVISAYHCFGYLCSFHFCMSISFAIQPIKNIIVIFMATLLNL